MAKINHNNYLDVVDSVWTAAKEKGIMHIDSEEQCFDGTHFRIKGKELINFGTCGYLALETHPDLIANSIDLTRKFGTQLSMSRAYIRPTYLQELEELMSQIFQGNKVICYTSTSNAHISVISTIIKPDDLIILDQQVHFSVQFPCKNTKLQGTTVKMIRHSDWEALDEVLREEANNYNRIWYMADGVYSMHGDLPDTDKLKPLLEKHPKLHLYFDDAHGMGWSGTNGAGYIFDRLGVSNRIIIISTLAKGFGSVGGTAIFSDPEMYRKVDIFGGPLSYSHPLTPGCVGAAIASAKICLSPEINVYQQELRDLMDHMNRRLEEKNLPNISSLDSPIYYIGSGLNRVTRNFVQRILQEGYYVNTATFPVVPNDKSGLRFTLTRHNTKADIDGFTEAMAYHLPRAIEEENDRIERVYEEFNVPYLGIKSSGSSDNQSLKMKEYTTIRDIDAGVWDAALGDRGNFTHSGLLSMEELFTGNEKPEDNWSFHYVLIKDRHDELVLATFFTGAIYKDDMLARENISAKIEVERKKDPYFLCSKTLAQGALFAEADFTYLRTDHPEWKQALPMLFDFVDKTKRAIDASVVIFRDFDKDHVMNKILTEEGYGKINMPNSNIISNPKWESYDELLDMIHSKKARYSIRRYAMKTEHLFDITIKTAITDAEAKKYYRLFRMIKDNTLAFNFFPYPERTPEVLSHYDEWEFLDIRLKGSEETIAVAYIFKGENHLCPIIIGMNYNYIESHFIYKQLVFQIVKRGNELNKSTVYCGFSADFEKQKYGAVSIPKFAYLKVDDIYNFELIETYANNE
jgi:7-keto-8-aminopelargonate synthetase-like enzyme